MKIYVVNHSDLDLDQPLFHNIAQITLKIMFCKAITFRIDSSDY